MYINFLKFSNSQIFGRKVKLRGANIYSLIRQCMFRLCKKILVVDPFCTEITDYRLFMSQSTQRRFYNDVILSVDRVKVSIF